MGLGVVPASAAATPGTAYNVGVVYRSSGYCYCNGFSTSALKFGGGYGTGDVVAVRLDLDRNTVAFEVNGEEVGGSRGDRHQTIAPDEDGYHFAFETGVPGDAVTIVDGFDRSYVDIK